MFENMAIWRLRHFAEECRRSKHSAIDASTQKECAEFERLFRRLASEVEAGLVKDAAR